MKQKERFENMAIVIMAGIAGIILFSTIGAMATTAPAEEWNKTFGGMYHDLAYSVQQTTDGGYIFAGKTNSFGAGWFDAWLIKTDSSGNEEWNKTFGGISYEQANSVQQTTDGGYILAGYTNSFGAGSIDAWLIKTDSSGNKLWSKTFGGIDNDYVQSVQQTTDGGYILAGYTNSFGAGWFDAWLIKTDSSGNEEWSKTFGGSSFDAIYSVQQTTDGGYILAGYIDFFETSDYDSDYDGWLIKTDSSGNEQWNKTLGGIDDDYAYSVQQTSDSGYILAGYTYSFGAGIYDAWLVKTDSSGNEQWNKTFGGTIHDTSYSVQQTSDSGYILAVKTDSFGAGSWDAWLIKTDSSGNEQWNKTFGGIDYDIVYSVQQTSDGGYVLAGQTRLRTGYYDAWLIKVSSDGTVPTPTPTPTPSPTPISTKLSFPLKGYTPYTAPISSVFDHSGNAKYSDADKKVIAFNGEIGNKGPYKGSACYAKSDKSVFGSGFNYVGTKGTGGKYYLCYNGHPGIDIPVPKNTPVYAAANGIAHIPKSFPGISNAKKYNTIEIDHQNGYKTYYMHLNSQNVIENQNVKGGETIIGYSGDKGSSGAYHLHFEVQIKVQKNGIPVDPYGWTGNGNDPYTRSINIKLWE